MLRKPLPALIVLLALPGCEKPDLRAGVDEVRYVFSLDIGPDATAGFVCIASVTDSMGRGTLRTKPFRVMAGKAASEALDEPVSGSRFEATVKVDATGARATYRARLIQKGQRSVVFEATRDIPKA
jgi:hypothetical protein